MPEGNEEELDADILALKFSWYRWWGCCVVGAGLSLGWAVCPEQRCDVCVVCTLRTATFHQTSGVEVNTLPSKSKQYLDIAEILDMITLQQRSAPRWTAVFLLWTALCSLFLPAGRYSDA